MLLQNIMRLFISCWLTCTCTNALHRILMAVVLFTVSKDEDVASYSEITKNCSNISGCTEYMCIVPTKNRCIFLFPNNNPTTTKNFKAFCIYLQKKKQVLIKS